MAIHKLDHKYNWDEVTKIMLKDTEEKTWVPALHDIDPEKMEKLILKMGKDKANREAEKREKQPGDISGPDLASRPASGSSPCTSPPKSDAHEHVD